MTNTYIDAIGNMQVVSCFKVDDGCIIIPVGSGPVPEVLQYRVNP